MFFQSTLRSYTYCHNKYDVAYMTTSHFDTEEYLMATSTYDRTKFQFLYMTNTL